MKPCNCSKLTRSKRGRGSKRKGARGEREVIDLLQPIVDTAYKEAGRESPQLKRTSSMQADDGGCDVHGLPWLALEVKRCETLQIESWWRQCVEQAKGGQLPALVYRQNKRTWRARVCLQEVIDGQRSTVVDIAIVDFLVYFKSMLELAVCYETGRIVPALGRVL
jgi:hypothetical protein